jgi:hypothetical protein
MPKNKNKMPKHKKRSVSGNRVLAELIDHMPDSEYKQHVVECISKEDYIQLASREWSPSDGVGAWYISQAIKKFPFATDQKVLEQEALRSYKEFEDELVPMVDDWCGFNWPHELVNCARDIIANILGEFPGDEAWVMSARLGSHAAVGCRGKNATAIHQSARLTYTREATRLVSLLDDTSFGCSEFVQTPGAEVGFVPKTYKSLRTITVEPSLNMFFQLGLGELIHERLRRIGIDAKDQSINQNRLSYDIGTIDLKSASDSIHLGHLIRLLPDDWIDAIDECRSRFHLLPDGTAIEAAKVAGMGNGFTFPLETMIFYAVSKAAMMTHGHTGKVTVYGDDIIVPRTAAPTVVSGLQDCGFVINLSKSFWDGPYRESCGVHLLNGCIVRPVYVKSRDFTNVDYVLLLNNILATAGQNTDYYLCSTWRHFYRKLIQLVDIQSLPVGPVIRDISNNPFKILIHGSFVMDPKYEIGATNNADQLDGFYLSHFTSKTDKVFANSIERGKSKLNCTDYLNCSPYIADVLRNYMVYQIHSKYRHASDLHNSRRDNPFVFGDSGGNGVIHFSRRTLRVRYRISKVFIPMYFVLSEVSW